MHGTAVLLLDVVVIALVFYGLALLTGLVHEVREAREALGSLAVARERRRIARDVHDLLGHGLSAIALKGELAARDPDARRAAGHLADAARLARRALADLRAIPGQAVTLTLDAELASVRHVLSSAGVAVRVRGEAGGFDPAMEDLFATVLREAAANVLRHGAAGCSCTIEVARGMLRVTNRATPASAAATDPTSTPASAPISAPATTPPASPGPAPVPEDVAAGPSEALGGNGIRNLRDRAALLGARVESGPTADGRGYTLTLHAQVSPVPTGG
ncbi:histidine kinase [Streptomyces venezuelae]|uniref:sensor histidine kinase n=1 Tax=Streptomyces sp. B6(2022) TaxID=3404749 RepID=UPI00311D5C50